MRSFILAFFLFFTILTFTILLGYATVALFIAKHYFLGLLAGAILTCVVFSIDVTDEDYTEYEEEV
jgi:hypothetical protein